VTRAGRYDAVTRVQPDSTASASSAGPLTDGSDGAYRGFTASFCGAETLCHGGWTIPSVVCSGTAVGFVPEANTGLSWQGDHIQTANVSSAATSCAAADWDEGLISGASVDLPTPLQLVELLDFGAGGGSLVPKGLGGAAGPYLGYTVGLKAWTVHFDTGAFEAASGTDANGAYVRCINAAPAAGPLPGDGSATCDDRFAWAGLSFQSPALPMATASWQGALEACNTLGDTCGTWRLPSYKELATLVNFTASAMGNACVDALNGTYWSATPSPANPDSQAMAITFKSADGGASHGAAASKMQSNSVLCVRDGP